MSRPSAVIAECACGCGRVGEIRGHRRYVRACYERWRRAGFPDSGPPPAAVARPQGTHMSARERYSANAVKRAHTARYRWAVKVAVEVATGDAAMPDPVWEGSAACRDLPPGWSPALWFPRTGSPSHDVRARCDACPVRRECLTTAYLREEEDGVWAGLSTDQRARAMTRARARVEATRPPQDAQEAA